MAPINTLCRAVLSGDNETINKMLGTLNIQLSQQDREQVGKPLLKTVMRSWMDAADAILEMIVLHLPSPKEAQKYRYKYLY